MNTIRVYAYHGCLDEEAKIGSDYHVNLSVEADLQKAAKTDELNDTADYVKLNTIVKTEMAQRSNLLENVAQRIIDSVLKNLPMVENISVSVAKINPPLGGDVKNVSVELSQAR